MSKNIVLSPKRLLKRIRLIMFFFYATLKRQYVRRGHVVRFMIVSIIFGNLLLTIDAIHGLLCMPNKLVSLLELIFSNLTVFTMLYAIYLDEYLRALREFNESRRNKDKDTESL